MGGKEKKEGGRERERYWFDVVVRRERGGVRRDVTVTLATLTHILQPLPQRKNVFLQHAITTDYRSAFIASELLARMKEAVCAVHICECKCMHVYTSVHVCLYFVQASTSAPKSVIAE